MPANSTDLPTGSGSLPPGGAVPTPPTPRTPCRVIVIIVAVIVFVITLFFPPLLPDPVTTILLIRHAEKVDETAGSLLTDAGTRRANELVHVAGQAGIQKIYATQFVRTQLTVQPLATALNLPVDTNFHEDNVRGLVADILANHRGQTVLIAHHSNRVPEIVQEFTRLPGLAVGEAEFDRLHVIHHHRRDAKALLFRYLAPPPP